MKSYFRKQTPDYLLPERFADVCELLVDVASHHPAVLWQNQRYAQSIVASVYSCWPATKDQVNWAIYIIDNVDLFLRL